MNGLEIGTIDEIPTYIRELLVKMEFIGKVHPGWKINIRYKIYSDPVLWYTPVSRYLSGEDASKTCDYIDRAINELEDALREYRDPTVKMRQNIVAKSRIFRQGLKNLISTYGDNAYARARLEASLATLDLRVPENKQIVTTTPPADSQIIAPGSIFNE